MFAARLSCATVLLLAIHLCAAPALHAQKALPIFGNHIANNPVERVLASRVTLQLEDMKLQEFAATLRERFRINVIIDEHALDDVGLGTDTPLKGIQVDGVELETAINVLLDRLELCFIVRDFILVITTPEEAENHLSTYVYPVGTLLDMWTSGYPGDTRLYPDYDSLIELITSSLSPDTWDEVGGAGSIEVYPDGQALVISQTRDVHKQIQALFDTLRKARSLQPLPRGSVPRNVGSIPYRPGGTPASGVGVGSYPANMGGYF